MCVWFPLQGRYKTQVRIHRSDIGGGGTWNMEHREGS